MTYRNLILISFANRDLLQRVKQEDIRIADDAGRRIDGKIVRLDLTEKGGILSLE